MAELIRLGAYKAGTNPEVDDAVRLYPQLEAFLAQTKTERAALSEGYDALSAILGGRRECVMNRTDTLLRLKRFRVDEMKRRMASIDAMKADLERKLTDLDDNVAREKQRAGDSDIGRLAFPSFLRSIEARRENLRTTLKEIEREYAAAQADLANAFQDLKSLEVATEQQARRLAEIQARRAQARLDEMAMVRHLRKHTLRSA